MKLSKAQQKVIDLMRDGWELGHSSGFRTHTWLQQNGVGRGGATQTIQFGTFDVLRRKGLIEVSGKGYPTVKYKLTALGSDR